MRLRLAVRVGRGDPRRHPFFIASAIVHTLIAVVVVVAPTLGGKKTNLQPVLSVELFPAMPGPAPQASAPPAAAAPAPPEPPEPTEDVVAQQEDPPEKPKPKPKKKKTTEKKPPPKKTTPRPSNTPPSTDTAPDPGDTEQSGQGSATGVETAFPGLGERDQWYQQSVMMALHVAWKQPPLGGSDSLAATVEFVILRDGTARSPQVITSSGVPALDRSALRAVSEASLPPLPRSFSKSSLPATVVFRWVPE